jgi:hypothetical protein
MKYLFFAFFCSVYTFGFSQPGARDLSFANFNEYCSLTMDLGIQSTGKVIICGSIVLENFVVVNIIRLNQDGTKDNTFNDYIL